MVGNGGNEARPNSVEDMEFVSLAMPTIKQELIDSYEALENFETTDGDPMNLLEVATSRSPDEVNDEGEEVSFWGDRNDSGIGNRTNVPTAERWKEWQQEYPWMLREESDSRQVFCLYCGTKLVVNRGQNLKRHETSRSHEERAENYLAFQRTGRWSAKSADIKAEFSSNSAQENLKLQRLLQTQELNDFNWERWTQAHPWLERKNKEATKGICKYCNVEVGVEFTIDRQRHEDNIKHKLAEKYYKRQHSKELNDSGSNLNDSKSEKEEKVERLSDNGGELRQRKSTSENENVTDMANKTLKRPWFEAFGEDNGQCKLCKMEMDKEAFAKHMKSRIHTANLVLLRTDQPLLRGETIEQLREKEEKTEPAIDWNRFARIHPWLTADPTDSKFAYCNYCEKRFKYGLSSVKRFLHENSASHKQAISQQIRNTEQLNESNRSSRNNDSNANEKDKDKEKVKEVQNNENNTVSEQQSESSREDEQDDSEEIRSKIANRKNTFRVGSAKYFAKFPHYKSYPENPDYIFCKICKIPLPKTFRRGEHEKSARHQMTTKKRATTTKEEPTKEETAKALTSVYPWLIRTQNRQNRCKYCKIKLSGRNTMKHHEKTKQHKWCAKQAALQLSQEEQTIEESNANTNAKVQDDNIASSSNLLRSMPVRVMMLRSKFPWLSYRRKEERPDYLYCNYCDQSIYMPTIKYGIKHQRSSRHMSARATIRAKRAKKGRPDLSTEDEAAEPDLNNFDWLVKNPTSDKDNAKLGYCKVCKKKVFAQGFMKVVHQSSQQHQIAVKKFLRKQQKKEEKNDIKKENKGEESKATSSVPVTESTDASKQTSQPSSKRSTKATNDARSAYLLASRLTNAHTEILSLMRELGGTNTDISPFAIADALALPVASKTKVIEEPPTAAMATPACADTLPQHDERNTYDLFFESMSETVKRLPPDLAAESRIKVMQVVYDLEMRALQRANTPEGSASAKEDPIATTVSEAKAKENSTRLVTTLRKIRKNSTIEFITVNGHISPLCKET